MSKPAAELLFWIGRIGSKTRIGGPDWTEGSR